jgi:hypothetical protein
MKITKMKYKTKIEFEYTTLPNDLGFGIIGDNDLKKLVVNVFLKDGRRIYHENIEKITIKEGESIFNFPEDMKKVKQNEV